MPKLPTCDHCLYCAHDYHLICAVHPAGPLGATCPDFAPNPELEGKQFRDFLGLEPRLEETEWDYNPELEIQSPQIPSTEEQIWLLGKSQVHPMFTGVCPACGAEFEKDYLAVVFWDCECGWTEDLNCFNVRF